MRQVLGRCKAWKANDAGSAEKHRKTLKSIVDKGDHQ